MRIGIDIDGVLTDCERFVTEYGIKYCMENNLTYRIRLNQYNDAKLLGISPEKEEKFWNKYLKYYVTEYRPRDFAQEIVNKLKNDGHEIYIVTARNEWGFLEEDYGKMREYTEEWLKNNNINYDKIIFTEGSKLPYCIGNYIDVLIEDAPKNIKDVSKKLPVICYHSDYNSHIKGRNITRAYSWYDVYNKIKNM